jgi:hypothetical protein
VSTFFTGFFAVSTGCNEVFSPIKPGFWLLGVNSISVLAATSTFTVASESTVLMALVIVSPQPEQTIEGTLSSIAIIKQIFVDDSIIFYFNLNS